MRRSDLGGGKGRILTGRLLKVGLLVVESGVLVLELVLKTDPVVRASTLLGDVLVHAVLGLRTVLVERVGVGCARSFSSMIYRTT